jgi:hypothetical protein
MGRSRRQGGETPLQKPTHCWIAPETDGERGRIAGFALGTGLGHEVCARGPVGLVFAEPGIGGDVPHRLKGGVGTLHLRDSQRPIDNDPGESQSTRSAS